MDDQEISQRITVEIEDVVTGANYSIFIFNSTTTFEFFTNSSSPRLNFNSTLLPGIYSINITRFHQYMININQTMDFELFPINVTMKFTTSLVEIFAGTIPDPLDLPYMIFITISNTIKYPYNVGWTGRKIRNYIGVIRKTPGPGVP